MAKLTLQEVFNNAYRAFVFEKKPPAYDSKLGQCSYRGDDGARCMIGLSLPDELYTSEIEGVGISVMLDTDSSNLRWGIAKKLFLGLFNREDAEALAELQRLHDQNSVSFAWNEGVDIAAELQHFAMKYELTLPEENIHAQR